MLKVIFISPAPLPESQKWGVFYYCDFLILTLHSWECFFLCTFHKSFFLGTRRWKGEEENNCRIMLPYVSASWKAEAVVETGFYSPSRRRTHHDFLPSLFIQFRTFHFSRFPPHHFLHGFLKKRWVVASAYSYSYFVWLPFSKFDTISHFQPLFFPRLDIQK